MSNPFHQWWDEEYLDAWGGSGEYPLADGRFVNARGDDEETVTKKSEKKRRRHICADMAQLDRHGIPWPYKAYPILYGERRYSRKEPEKKFPFLDLPPEIRNRIYRHVLVLPTPVDLTQRMLYSGGRRNWYRREMHPRARLLRANKQIYAEALWFFYGCNEWKFIGSDDAWILFYFWLLTIGPKNVRLVENVTISLPWTDWYEPHRLSTDPISLRIQCIDKLKKMGLKTRRILSNDYAITQAFKVMEQAGVALPEEASSDPKGGAKGLRSLRLVMDTRRNIYDIYCILSTWSLVRDVDLSMQDLQITIVRLHRQSYLIAPNDRDHPRNPDPHGDIGYVRRKLNYFITRAREYGWKVAKEYSDEHGCFPVKNYAWVDGDGDWISFAQLFDKSYVLLEEAVDANEEDMGAVFGSL